MFSVIWQKLKEIIHKMLGGKTIEQTLHVVPAISSVMETSIQKWLDMYTGNAPWLQEPTFADPVRITSLGLPAMIASEKARTALLEFKSEITTPTEDVEVKNPNYKEPTPDEFGNLIPSAEPPVIKEAKPKSNTARAEYLNKQYQEKIIKKLRAPVEYMIAGGGLVIKPYVVSKTVVDEKGKETIEYEIEADFVIADNFYPLSFNANKQVTEAAFVETKADKDTTYRRLEYHKWSNNQVTIVNKAFKSTANGQQTANARDLGQEIPLTTVPEWAELKDRVVIKNVAKPLFAYIKMPEANTVDMHSPLGASGFSRAENLIKDADMQYSRLLWEYEAGEMAIDVDRDALAFREDSGGAMHTVLGRTQQRIFRKVDLGESNTYAPFAPTLRDASFTQGLNTVLMRIEDVCAISRGTLSDAAAEARTATELKILKQRSYQANADIQQALEDGLKEVIYIMNVYCDLYEITPTGEYDTSFEWDDSIIVDVDTELAKRLQLQQAGISSKLETRMWYFGETERQAREALQKVNEDSMQQMEQDLIKQANEVNLTQKQEPQENNVK